MRVRAWVCWAAFAAYCALLCSPLWLLWDKTGLIAGGAIVAAFLMLIRFRGGVRIAGRLGVRWLPLAELPAVHATVAEYCRRLNVALPTIGVLESDAINFTVFGFSYRRSYFVITRGSLERLTRAELSAMLGREISYLWRGDFILESWLSRFLSVFEHWLERKTQSHGRRSYPYRQVFVQMILYPFILFPCWVLRRPESASEIDLKSARITRRPRQLGEALRKMEAQRMGLSVSLSLRHLFCLPPLSEDPLMRVFSGTSSLYARILKIEKLRQPV